MKFEFYDSRDDKFTREVCDCLWEQNVNMDDWDYMLFFPIEYEASFPKGWDNIQIQPSNYNIDRLLCGCCSNKWYPVTNFLGKKGFLGVAYHA